MSKKKEMIQLFDSISKFNTYSKYSNSLKKIFKNKSLKDYIKSLKNPIHVEGFQLINDFDKRTSKLEEEDEFHILPKGYLKKGKQLDLLHEESNPEPEEKKEMPNNNTLNKNDNAKSMTNFNISLIKKNQELDPFKYNPNYNSIYKNIHSFKIILPSKKIINKKAKSQTFLTINKKKKIKRTKKNIKIINIDNANCEKEKNFRNIINNNFSENNLKSRNYNSFPALNDFSYLSRTKSKNKNNKKDKNKENHAFRFSKYIPRKMNIYNVNKRLTYLNYHFYSPSNKNNKAIDFNKMENRDSNRWINMTLLKNPSIYYYNPKYDSIEKQPLKILFNPNDFVKNNKKYLIKKIWASYNVKKDYESIDNDKLNS